MPWNKGLTKLSNPSVLKISETMKSRKLDNFSEWRRRMRNSGLIPDCQAKFTPSKELAEFIGVILGDGNISIFPRTERLIIVGNANNMNFIDRYALITEKLFNKKPTITKIKGANAIRISIYQNNISSRLGIPVGNRLNMLIKVDNWIFKNDDFLISFLRGLFEAEGSLSIHIPTCTYNFAFTNFNASLLNIVSNSLKLLGFHLEVRKTAIRLRKKAEVIAFKELIGFRIY